MLVMERDETEEFIEEVLEHWDDEEGGIDK